MNARARRSLALAALLLLAALLAALVTAGSRYAADLRQARERLAGRSALAHTPCGAIEYAVLGAGRPLLLVHGAGGGFDQGLEIAEALARQGLQVIAMSRFGYLRTPLPADASAAAQADAHACLLDHLGIARAAIAGISAGAPSALQFALRHPQRTLALMLVVPALAVPREGAPPTAPPPATALLFDTALRSDLLFWAASRVARDTMIESILATPPAVVQAADAGERSRIDRILAQILPVSARRLGLLNDARVTSTPSPIPLERIAAPALLVSVRDDGFGTWDAARWAASRLPRARFVGYASGGHVWVGHHEALLRELAAFALQPPAPQ